MISGACLAHDILKGRAEMKELNYGRQYIDGDDIKAVKRALKSDRITQGPAVKEFEDALSAYCGAKYAVAVSSGTAALHLACIASGLGKGDEAVTTPVTFLATPNSVLYSGAKPVFADIDHDSVNITPYTADKKIRSRTKAILPVHFAGLPVDMVGIDQISRKKQLTVIEDACHALGAQYKYRREWVRVGSCKHSDMTVFSFHPVKAITTAEGGAITTNRKSTYETLCSLRNHGTVKDSSTRKKGPWYYEMRGLGYNYRMNDIQASLGISQLGKLDGFLKRREEIAQEYEKAFSGIEELIPPQRYNPSLYRHARHLYLLRISPDRKDIKRGELFSYLQECSISPQVHYIPVYMQPFYRENGYRRTRCPGAEMYYSNVLSLPLYPSMLSKDTKHVIDSVRSFFSRKK
jgi:UDP-4-amino-4,6-dideoxy-N-acetyl-beta-L-altrosamine transaminase